MNIEGILGKIDFKISGSAYSRPERQVELIVDRLLKRNRSVPIDTVLDVGGGFDGKYKDILSRVARKYTNMEIKRGSNVDFVGSVYKIPLLSKVVDLTS